MADFEISSKCPDCTTNWIGTELEQTNTNSIDQAKHSTLPAMVGLCTTHRSLFYPYKRWSHRCDAKATDKSKRFLQNGDYIALTDAFPMRWLMHVSMVTVSFRRDDPSLILHSHSRKTFSILSTEPIRIIWCSWTHKYTGFNLAGKLCESLSPSHSIMR